MCLVLGVGNYVKTVEGYGKRVAIVQTGWKTQSVSCSFYSNFLDPGRRSLYRVIESHSSLFLCVLAQPLWSTYVFMD